MEPTSAPRKGREGSLNNPEVIENVPGHVIPVLENLSRAVHEASGGHHNAAPPGRLVDYVAALAITLVGHGTCVDHVDVGWTARRNDGPPGGGKIGSDRFGLRLVETTAEGVEGDATVGSGHGQTETGWCVFWTPAMDSDRASVTVTSTN